MMTTDAGAIFMLRVDVADCFVGEVESVTVKATEAEPTELWAGVPVIDPFDGLIDRPAGKPLAVNVYGMAPPEAATGLLYPTPTVPPGSELVVIVRLLDGEEPEEPEEP